MKLEPIYLMNIIKYIDRISTLKIFSQVSENCLEAMKRTRINPFGECVSLTTALTNSRLQSIIEEIELFPSLQTLAIDSHSLISLGKYQLSSVSQIDFMKFDKIHIYKYIMTNNKEDYQLISSLSSKIVSIGIDTSYDFNPNFNSLISLKSLTIRVRITTNIEFLTHIFTSLSCAKYLNTLIIHTDSSSIPFLLPLTESLSDSISITFIIDWLYKEDLIHISNLLTHRKYKIGIMMINMDIYVDFYSHAILLPFSERNFQISAEMALDKHLPELLNTYYPSRIEIQGGSRHIVNNEEGCIIDLSELKHLEELFINDALYTNKISLRVPSQLKYLVITSPKCINEIEGLTETQLPSYLIDHFLELL